MYACMYVYGYLLHNTFTYIDTKSKRVRPITRDKTTAIPGAAELATTNYATVAEKCLGCEESEEEQEITDAELKCNRCRYFSCLALSLRLSQTDAIPKGFQM